MYFGFFITGRIMLVSVYLAADYLCKDPTIFGLQRMTGKLWFQCLMWVQQTLSDSHVLYQ